MRIVSTLTGTGLIMTYSVIGALLMSDWAVTAASGRSLDVTVTAMQAANQAYSIVPGILFAALGGVISIVWAFVMLSPHFKVSRWVGLLLWSGIMILGAPAYFFASFGNLNSVGDTFLDGWNPEAAFALEMPLYLASGLALLGGVTASVIAVKHYWVGPATRKPAQDDRERNDANASADTAGRSATTARRTARA